MEILGSNWLSRGVKNLLIINIAVFIAQYFFGGVMLKWFALYPFLAGFMPWQLVTYQFMHAGFVHLFFNMLCLFGIGFVVEDYFISTKEFIIFYLLCGIVGGLAQNILFIDSTIPMVGASGAIWGLLASLLLICPKSKLYLFFILPVTVWVLIVILFVLELFGIFSGGGVSHACHIGGALAGIGLLYGYNKMNHWKRVSKLNNDEIIF